MKIAFEVHGIERLPLKEHPVLVVLTTGKVLVAKRIGEILWKSLMIGDWLYEEILVDEIFLWAYLDQKEYINE